MAARKAYVPFGTNRDEPPVKNVDPQQIQSTATNWLSPHQRLDLRFAPIPANSLNIVNTPGAGAIVQSTRRNSFEHKIIEANRTWRNMNDDEPCLIDDDDGYDSHGSGDDLLFDIDNQEVSTRATADTTTSASNTPYLTTGNASDTPDLTTAATSAVSSNAASNAPPHIRKLCREIKAHPKRTCGLFNRALLTREFPKHFCKRDHNLLLNSPIRQYEGDLTLFTQEEWQLLTEVSHTKGRGNRGPGR